jgi:lysophospholipase L1-like esterase
VLLQKGIAIRKDSNLSYLDGLKLFNEADVADLPDRLHPNDAGYQRMGERFAKLSPEMAN